MSQNQNISNCSFTFPNFKLEEILPLMDKDSLKFQILKILYEDDETIIQVKNSINQKNEENILSIKDFLSKKSIKLNCSICKKEILSFDFAINLETKNTLVCNNCYIDSKNKEDNKYSLFEDHITKCEKHNKN